jgi:hypothetical protein
LHKHEIDSAFHTQKTVPEYQTEGQILVLVPGSQPEMQVIIVAFLSSFPDYLLTIRT